ncbi:MAG: transcription elongation factor GreB [Polyangiaceae bacterium]|jgi:transcription elongation factor GreB
MSDPLPNYITREGARKLQEELANLRSVQRPAMVKEVADAAAQGDRSENAEYIYGKRKLREIDRRMRWLTERLIRAVVVERREVRVETVYFGAIVELQDAQGTRTRYRIVGEDEIDLDRGCVSWRSPLGRALLKRSEGDTVRVRRPHVAAPGLAPSPDSSDRDVEMTIVRVEY